MASCCNEHNEDSGIIKSEYILGGSNTLGGSNYNVDIDCLITPDTACIRNDSEYKELFRIDSVSYCKNATLPSIDFNKYSLLVNRKSILGRVYFHRNVVVDSLNKIITYQISIQYCRCIDVCHSQESNIVLVPAISKDFRIVYK
jgi:hypothetical protein